MRQEGTARTLIIATGVALFCSVMVSAAVYWLRPLQAAYQLVDRNRAILEAAGRLPDGEVADTEIVERFLALDAGVIDLESGWFVSGFDAHAYDHWTTGGEQSGERPRYVPVYRVLDGDRLERLVLPVDGAGMWSTIYAYLALEPDLDTIARFVVYRHAETPGIGDKIEEPGWLEGWRGKRVYGDDGTVAFRVEKRASGPNAVDAISGATVTSTSTGRLVSSWLGPDGYQPFLDNLAERGP
jgi:Na+-transporting NADH:ubiquinone oxidoreductase subunit C